MYYDICVLVYSIGAFQFCFILAVSFFVTRLHERPLHFEKITFYTCMRALKYYIISK